MHVADPSYGPISIHDIDILQLIDTKAFQRLAYIKQQGHTYFLHENAIHTREEHSIGVYVLVNLVIAEQGIPYIEQLMKMKKGLYNNGFGHPFVVGKDLLLQSIFQKIKEKNLSFHTPEIQNFFYKRKQIEIEDFLPLQDEMIINEIKCFAKSDDIEIAELIHLYFSATKSLSFEKGIEGDYKKKNSTAVVITEKKAYSSYVGGIYVYSEGQLDDILEKSNFIQEIVKLPKKEYAYFF
ncbi:UNVERIFIED_ORG: HD superfamily phosphohydrolase [Bacillus thuringiensis]|nr:HD superfamily phosphohydrolase [Bacillus thuringiensis]